ncbi:MAG: cysteine desulfurase [Rhodospirillales bacterium]|nr:cysteine desulfurase [Rhodospirillales bacterium]MSP81326.1 cysteine desulfurase [Rhodospirillales bacterium]
MTHGATYLDHNATTPIRPEAGRAMAVALARTGNPSSVHRFGRAGRRAVEDAREQIAALVGARPEQTVFTSGGTEANAMALRGAGRARILVSAVEHASVLAARPDAERVPVNPDGVIELDVLEAMLSADSRPALVSIMLANNETGAIQPVARAAEIARRHGALVHCDAIQAAGKVSVDMAGLGAHLLTLSAHKLGGPMGAGALVVEDSVALEALQKGGGQERGLRAGTENVSGIAGFGAAAEAAAAEIEQFGRLAAWRDDLEARARAAVPTAQILAAGALRLPNTSCLALPGVAAETQVIALDLAGVAIGAGSACSSGKVGPSHVLAAMGVGQDIAAAAIRVSFGWSSAAADVERFLEAWTALAARTASRTQVSAA